MDIPDTHTFFHGVCWQCKSFDCARRPLQRCGGCQLLSYCSRDCQKDNRSSHKYVCKKFPVVDGKNVLHTTEPWDEHIAGLLEQAAHLPNADGSSNPLFLNPWVCNFCHEADKELLTVCKCNGVSYCSRKCSNADKAHKKDCRQFGDMIQTCSFSHTRLAYPRSLVLAMLLMHEEHKASLKENTSLTVHIITCDAMLVTMSMEKAAVCLYWDFGFADQFPKLKQLKLDFIMQGVPPVHLDTKRPVPSCEECESKGRNITYSFHHMKYHMFFSSEDYSKPDVVAIYGNAHEMSPRDEDAVHSEISYRNMIYSHDTIVVLMDATKDLVEQGVRAMNALQPVEQILATQINPLRGFTLNPAFSNEKYYLTCLRRK